MYTICGIVIVGQYLLVGINLIIVIFIKFTVYPCVIHCLLMESPSCCFDFPY